MRMVNVIRETKNGGDCYPVEDHFFNKRSLFLTEEVNQQSVAELIKNFLYLDQIAPGKPIKLFISSPGGNINAGLCLYNVIRMLRSPVKTINIGTAASMASILFLSADTRLMLPDSLLMIHDPSAYFEEGLTKTNDVKERLETLLVFRERLSGIISERSGKPIDDVNQKTAQETWFTANQAVEYGIATDIVESISTLL